MSDTRPDPASPPTQPQAQPQPPMQPQPPVQGPPSQPTHGPRAWWHQATATPGRRLGAGFAALLAILGLLGVLTLGALAVGAVAFGRGHGGSEMGRVDDRGGMGGWGRQQDRQGPRQGWGQGPDRGQGYGDDDSPGGIGPYGYGSGRGSMGGGVGMGGMSELATALHGEFTTNATGTPTVMLFQNGQVTAVTGTTSITVKSSDGFTGTYALSAATTALPTQPTVGATVRVLAVKEGAAATRILVLSQGTGATS